MAIGGYCAAFIPGFGLAGCSNASLLCELSSLFLNYKDMFTAKTKDSCLAEVNQICFFLSYTACRMVLFPYIIIVIYKEIVAVWAQRNWFQNTIAIYVLLQAIAVTLLNFYWYMLILKGLKRLLAAKGLAKKDESLDKLDEFESHA